MIQTPTTLVLGAGASAHLGFPLGYGLVQRICGTGPSRKLGPVGARLVNYGGFPSPDVQRFIFELSRSGRMSVDTFLEYRRDLMPIGKAAIAAALIEHENEEVLFAKTSPPNWYDLLWQAMRAPFENWGDNRLSIITFNYDRSLEHYLLMALSSGFGKSHAEAADQLRRLQMVHVHGSMGDHPLLGPRSRDYSAQFDVQSINQAAEGIRIVCEPGDTDPCFSQAGQFLMAASRVYFLGFGYDQTNVSRLGDLERWKRKQVRGTCYGLNETEMKAVRQRFGGDCIGLCEPAATVGDYIREAGLEG